jgi:peptidoglycan/LPS O-acetylase OafA/YrhL
VKNSVSDIATLTNPIPETGRPPVFVAAVQGPQGLPGAYRADIEGIRGIAVLLVVLFHVGVPGLSGGFIGVDIFFVLSGYLITGLLVNEVQTRRRVNFLHFYARRARRLLPASALVLLVTIAAAAVALSPLEQVQLSGTSLATSLYASNVVFLRKAMDYFGGQLESNPFLHTWSLAVEEQFYFIWPLVITLGLRHGKLRWLTVTVAAASAISLVGCVIVTRRMQPYAFFGSPTRVWEFGLGALASLVPAAALLTRPLRSAWLGMAGLVTVGTSAATFNESMPFPGSIALVPATATIAMLLAGVGAPQGGVSRVLRLRTLQHLGRLSYSWYLWHWPVLVLSAAVMPSLTVYGRLLSAAVSLGLAALSFHLLEQPIRGSLYMSRRPALSLSLAGAVTIVCAATAIGWKTYAGKVAKAPEQRALAIAQIDDVGRRAQSCMLGLLQETPKVCVFGAANSATSIVLFGDSHAMQWLPALELLGKDRGWRIITLLKSGCRTADVVLYHPRLKREFRECAVWREKALQRIVALQPSAVLFGNATSDVGARAVGATHVSYAAWRDGNRATLAVLHRAGIPAAIIRDTPFMGVSVPVCLSRAAYLSWVSDDDCVRKRVDALDPAVYDAEIQAAHGFPRMRTIDLSARFCDVAQCDAKRDGTTIYRDTNHISTAYARLLAPALGEEVDSLLRN